MYFFLVNLLFWAIYRVLFWVLFYLSIFWVHFWVLSSVFFYRITFLGTFLSTFFTTCGRLKPTSQRWPFINEKSPRNQITNCDMTCHVLCHVTVCVFLKSRPCLELELEQQPTRHRLGNFRKFSFLCLCLSVDCTAKYNPSDIRSHFRTAQWPQCSHAQLWTSSPGGPGSVSSLSSKPWMVLVKKPSMVNDHRD